MEFEILYGMIANFCTFTECTDPGLLEKVYSISRTEDLTCIFRFAIFDPWHTFIYNYLQAGFYVHNLITSLGSFSEFFHFVEYEECLTSAFLEYSFDIFLTGFCLFCSFGGGGYGGRKGAVGLWGLSSFAGSFLPISHLLMMAILSRPSIYNMQDMVREIGYLSSWQL